MQRLVCLLALCLVVSPALAQPIVASAATKRVQQRVQQLLERGSRLTPESLLTSSRHLAAAAASSAGPISPASSSKVSIASVGAPEASDAAAAVASAARPATAEPQQAELQGAVDVAGKEVQIKWAVKQSGTVKVETDDDSEDSYRHAQEAAEELLKSGRLFPTPAGNGEIEYMHVEPSPKEHHSGYKSDHETHKHHHDDSYKSDREEKYEHRARPKDEQHSRETHVEYSDSDSYKGDESELIQRLTQVDWQAVFEAAQHEAEAEEAAAVEKLKVASNARKVALQKRLDAAEADRRQADAERQQAEEERQKLQQVRKKTLEKLQDAEELRQRLEEQRQQAADELDKLAAAKRKAAEDRQQAEAVRRRAAEEAEEVKRHAAKQAETVKGIVTDEVERLAIAKQKAAERHAEAVKRRAEEVLSEAETVKRQAAEDIERLAIAKHKAAEQHAEAVKRRAEQEAEAVKRRAAEEAESAKDDAVDELKKLAAAKRRAAEQQADAVKRAASEEADAIKQRAAEDAKRAKSTDIRHQYGGRSKHYKDDHDDKPYKSSKDDYSPHNSDYKEYSEKEDEYGYEVDYEPAHRTKVVVQEKGRSPLRYFPGGGIYSFTSELTCVTDEEYREKASNKGFLPMITPRMKTITAGMCEWTVAEVSPTQVKRNSFLLGNAWGACTFLPIANKECRKPIVGGLSFTVQGLLYQFAQPKGIRGYEDDTVEYDYGGVTEAKTQSAKDTAKPATNAGSTTKAATAAESTAKTPAVGATVAIASAAPASAAAAATAAATAAAPKASAVSIAAKGSSNATAATAAAAAPTKAIKSRNGKYLMDVELQNVIIGLITGAYGPKKAHKYKQGAVQFAFGPPPDTDGKAYAIETRLPPTILGGPSLEELQEGMTQLVPGTYQIVFDEDY